MANSPVRDKTPHESRR